jgi:septal ring factor EnvC (AmiA/AmiB activator)
MLFRVLHHTSDIANVKNNISEYVLVRGSMQTLKEIRERIQSLESERARLIVEVEALRKAAESRATLLEGEVNQMREEAKSLRELLLANPKPPASPSTAVTSSAVLPSPH